MAKTTRRVRIDSLDHIFMALKVFFIRSHFLFPEDLILLK